MVLPLWYVLYAYLITHHLPGPRELRVQSWGWLAAEAGGLAGQKMCLDTIVALDPDLVWAQITLQGIRYRQVWV